MSSDFTSTFRINETSYTKACENQKVPMELSQKSYRTPQRRYWFDAKLFHNELLPDINPIQSDVIDSLANKRFSCSFIVKKAVLQQSPRRDLHHIREKRIESQERNLSFSKKANKSLNKSNPLK